MLVAILAGLLVSIDALFIGVSFGSQKKCKLWHLLIINTVLIGLCFLGYGLGLWIGDRIDVELDIVIGILFILLGAWTITSYYIFEKKKKHQLEDPKNDELKSNSDKKEKGISKNIVLAGLFMSIEAMFITIALTLTLDVSTIFIPLTVGFAHLFYSAFTFFFAKYFRRLPPVVGHIVAGSALIIYGVLALII